MADLKDYSIEELQQLIIAKQTGQDKQAHKRGYTTKEATVQTYHKCVLCSFKWVTEDTYELTTKRQGTLVTRRDMLHLTCQHCVTELTRQALGVNPGGLFPVTVAAVHEMTINLTKTLDHCVKVLQRHDRIISDHTIYHRHSVCIPPTVDEDYLHWIDAAEDEG